MFGRKVNASENIDLVSLERSEAERSEAERSGGLTKSAGSKLRVSVPDPEVCNRTTSPTFA